MDLAQKPVYKLDLAAGTSVVNLTTPLVEGDDRAQTFTLVLTDKGALANLNGYSVTAYFGRGKTAEAEADTIPLSGTVSGNVATITLTGSCYSRSCYFSMPIRLSNGATGQKRTYLIVRGTVVKSVDGKIIDPDGSVPDLDDLFAQIAVMERSRQAAEEATEEALAAAARADEAREGIQGDFVALTEEIGALCIYSEAEYDLDVGRESHYMSADDIPQLAAWEGANISSAIHLKKGQMITTLAETNDAITPIVTCGQYAQAPWSAFLRWHPTINYAVAQEDCYVMITYLKSSPVKKYRIADTVKTDGSPLRGLKIAYNGDSIGAHPYGYPYQVAQMTGGTYENNSVSGGTLAVRDGVHNVCTSVSSMAADADIVCFEGGINDYWMNIPLGDYSESDFSGAVDNTTVCGALESIFRQATEKWVGKPIVFIIVHKITTTAWTHNNAAVPYTFAHARDKMLGICKKYSIPVLDMWESGGLNAYIPALNSAYLNGGAKPADGCHPDENGYKKYYVPRLISLFESVTP